MWQLLTRCCTLLPPNHADIEFSLDGVNPVAGLTYGADLCFGRITDEYDETLRTTIMWCMSKWLLHLVLNHQIQCFSFLVFWGVQYTSNQGFMKPRSDAYIMLILLS